MTKTINTQNGTFKLINEIISEIPRPFNPKKAAKTVAEIDARIDQIATEIAVYFNERVSPGELAEWNTSMIEVCVSFPNDTSGECSPLTFLYSIGWDLLPAVIDAAPRNRIETLKEKLITLYECERYEGTEEALRELGSCHSKAIKKYRLEEEVGLYKHLTIYAAFQYILNCYKEYEFLKELRENYEE